MGHAIPVRTGYTAGEVRRLAQRAKDAAQARRLLAIAAVLDGASREEAATIGGMDRQTLRDWVIRFNEQGVDGLINIPSPGVPPKLNSRHINGPNRPTCSVRSAPTAEPAPPSCYRPATPKPCSFTSMRSQPKSLRALTLFSSSIKPAGMAPRLSRFQTTSRSYSSRHAHPNSTAKKISGNSCGRTGCRTEFSNPSTISSITAATLGTRSSISRGKLCPSPAVIGQPQVTQSEDWYNSMPGEE